MEYICPVCEGEIKSPNWNGRIRTYCSDSCRLKSERRRKKLNKANKVESLIPFDPQFIVDPRKEALNPQTRRIIKQLVSIAQSQRRIKSQRLLGV